MSRWSWICETSPAIAVNDSRASGSAARKMIKSPQQRVVSDDTDSDVGSELTGGWWDGVGLMKWTAAMAWAPTVNDSVAFTSWICCNDWEKTKKTVLDTFIWCCSDFILCHVFVPNSEMFVLRFYTSMFQELLFCVYLVCFVWAVLWNQTPRLRHRLWTGTSFVLPLISFLYTFAI